MAENNRLAGRISRSLPVLQRPCEHPGNNAELSLGRHHGASGMSSGKMGWSALIDKPFLYFSYLQCF